MVRDADRLPEALDVFKWLCRDFWTAAYRKPVDKLQTNQHGTYVLQDFSFAPLAGLSPAPGVDGGGATLRYVLLHCGMVRGALAALGLEALVNVDTTSLPTVFFHVKLVTPGGAPPPPTA